MVDDLLIENKRHTGEEMLSYIYFATTSKRLRGIRVTAKYVAVPLPQVPRISTILEERTAACPTVIPSFRFVTSNRRNRPRRILYVPRTAANIENIALHVQSLRESAMPAA